MSAVAARITRTCNHVCEGTYRSTVSSTADIGLDPDLVEAAAFAWLAMRTMKKQDRQSSECDRSSHKKVLGAIHYA